MLIVTVVFLSPTLDLEASCTIEAAARVSGETPVSFIGVTVYPFNVPEELKTWSEKPPEDGHWEREMLGVVKLLRVIMMNG